MSSQPGLRIGDADRERAQAMLADHYAAGRLDKDEYDQRLDQIWAARTRAELAPVFLDLPGAARASGGAPYSAAAGRARFNPAPRSGVRSWTSRMPAPLLVLLVVLGAIAVMANLPLILVGLGVWFFFFRGAGCGARRVHPSRRW
jgi:Domain of unknown function (DUF1707)